MHLLFGHLRWVCNQMCVSGWKSAIYVDGNAPIFILLFQIPQNSQVMLVVVVIYPMCRGVVDYIYWDFLAFLANILSRRRLEASGPDSVSRQ